MKPKHDNFIAERGPDFQERFWRKVDQRSSGCWPWTGYLAPNGYGQFIAHRDDKHKVRVTLWAHRCAYILTHGAIKDGLYLDHLCRTRHCVNPDHLQPVTARENLLRGDTKAAENAAKAVCKNGERVLGERMGARYIRCACFSLRRLRQGGRRLFRTETIAMANHFDLTDEIAVVTGSRGRLGGIWTQALRDAGALVIESDTPLVAMDAIRSNCDITLTDQIEQALDCWTAMYGPPTILVNNAGVDDRPTPTTMNGPRYEVGRRMAGVNLLGTYKMLTIVGAKMADAGRGSIINIASLYGLVAPDMRYYGDSGFEKHAMYGATKAGVISLTQYFAAYYGPKGVRVNALAPGGVVNPGDPLTGQDDGFRQRYTARIPMGRMCQPEDLGGPLVFLASKASSFVNGVVLPLDGGFLAW